MAQQIGIKLSLDGTAGVLSGLGQVQGGLGNLGTKISTVRDALTSFAPALAGAFTVGGLTAFVRNTTNAIDAMNDLADATGATIEEISKLDQVARRNGASLDSVGGMLVKFNAQLKEADGKNGAGMALQAIGLEASKLRALDPAEALQQTARALAGFADDGNKARIVQELFGKSVREAAPFLKDLAEAGVLNASVTSKQAAEAEKFNKQLFALQANTTDAARGLVSDLLPALNATLEKAIELNKVGWFKMFGKEITAEVKNVKLVMAGLKLDDLAGALAKDEGNRGLQAAVKAARQDVERLLRDSVAATKALKDLAGTSTASGAGAGRGDDINPPFARPKPSVRDIGGLGGNTTAAALSDEAKATAAAIQAREKYLDTLTATSSKMAQENTALADQVAALTLGKDAYQRMIDVREEEAAVLLETQAIRALDRNLDAREYEALMAQAAAIRQRIVLRRDLADATVQATDREIMARRAGLIDQDAAGALIDEQISKADALIAGIDGQTRALTMSNTEREVSIALLELERTGLDKNSDAYRDRERAIREAIANRETLREGIEQARRFEQEWQRTADQIGQSLSDALMQGGKSAWEYIKGLFRTTVLRPIIQAIVNPFTTAIGSALGMGNAMAGTGAAGALGSAGPGFGGLLSAGASLLNGTTGSMMGLNLVNSSLGQSLGLSSLQNIGGNMIAGPTGLGSMLGSGLGMAGNGFMGYGISKALSGGYSAGGAVNTIAGIASMIPGIGPIAGVVGGLVNRAFGMKAKEMRDQGIEGSLTGGMATGQQFQDWFQKGGWFRSNKSGTNRSALGDDMASALSAGSQAMFQQTQAFAQTLSLPAAALATITSQFKVKFSGDAAKDQAEIAALFTKYGEDLAETYRDQLAPFQRAGETISATLQRMSGLQQFSNTINDFGGIFSRVASLSVDAKEQLLGFAGGIEALLGKTQQFVSQYYDEAEQLGLTARAVQQQLAGLGITGELYTRADFRRLVEGTDISSEEGRQRLSQLLDIANAFAPVGQFLESQGGSLSLLANTAPSSGIVGNVLSLDSVTAATNAASDANVNTLERLIARVGHLEAALVRALDKNARAVADVIAYESNINIQMDLGGA
jgi:hypothetical protein